MKAHTCGAEELPSPAEVGRRPRHDDEWKRMAACNDLTKREAQVLIKQVPAEVVGLRTHAVSQFKTNVTPIQWFQCHV